MSETQLERSVLEAKERDELFAIADALGAKPGARAKKADLVTQILRATGIEPDDGADPVEKPRRTRARRTTLEATPDAGATGPTPAAPDAPARASTTSSAGSRRADPAPGTGSARTRGDSRSRAETAGRAADTAPADGESRQSSEAGPGEARSEVPATPTTGPADPVIGSEPPVLAGPVAGAPASRTETNGDGASGRSGHRGADAEPNGSSSLTASRGRVRGPGGLDTTRSPDAAAPSEAAAPTDPDGGNPDGGNPDGGSPDGRRPDGRASDGRTPDGRTVGRPQPGRPQPRRPQWAGRFRRSYPGVRRGTRQPEKPPTPGPGALREERPGPAGAGR